VFKTTIYIPASRERVFSAMTDYERYPKWAPGCEDCTILSCRGSITTIEMVVNSMRKVRLGLRLEAEQNQLLEFELTSSKDLRKYSGFYRFVTAADGKGTVMFAEMDMEVSSMPRFVTDTMAKRALAQLCTAFKTYVEKLPAAESGGAGSSQLQTAGPAPPTAPRRARRLMQIVKGPAGYRVWFLREAFKAKKIEGNVVNS
jgi:ribosome-associated toxin RatA of RatAB toxin-antitoxin module